MMNSIDSILRSFAPRWQPVPQDEPDTSLNEDLLIEMRGFQDAPASTSSQTSTPFHVSATHQIDHLRRPWEKKMIKATVALFGCVVVIAVFAATSFSGYYTPNTNKQSIEESRAFLPKSTMEFISQYPTSPQGRGLDWLEQKHPEFDIMPDWRRRQLLALSALLITYCGPDAMSIVDPRVDECDWEPTLGFPPRCTSSKAIQELRVPTCSLSYNSKNKNRQMVLPPEVSLLTGLADLDLHFSGLGQVIPTELGLLTRLTGLSLGHNGLKGTIPTQIGSLTNLEILFLLNNPLRGSLPSEIGRLTALRQLALVETNLSGSLPTQLQNLKSLREFLLNTNHLTGTVPSIMGMWSNLQNLRLEENQLTGSLPTEIGALTQMTLLMLDSNQLKGPIPSQFGRLTSLNSLELSSNQLTSTLPSQLGQLTSLTLHDNPSLTGSVPDHFWDANKLHQVWLQGTKLNGSVPCDLVKMNPHLGIHVNCERIECTCPVCTCENS